MKNVIIAIGVVVICIAISSAFGNIRGGLLVGIILAIVILKRVKSNTSIKEAAD
ncbi:hypothetical protein [Balneola vulgaris]|jgi:hypothetical protein|uniref:hypothetical protein n=1 Tax=Balneola vulgaris TaxID=287535 RepID=UPI000368C9F0|nr:hypothetical protein [Balneola vulgaris]